MARVPSYPSPLARPFADVGNKRSIPDSTGDSGRASLAAGFPPETQLPLNAGGVAPNRLDFNGVFNLLSNFAFWQQSGGQWSYSPELGYTPPCMVYHADKLWWCQKENGPDSDNGAYEPGADENYWIEFTKARGVGGGGGVPVGTVITYYGTKAPEGYLTCDGMGFSATLYPGLYAVLGKATTPDMRGLFVRGYDPAGGVDPGGAGRGLGSAQEDAMQNIVGEMGATQTDSTSSGGAPINGPFRKVSHADTMDLKGGATFTRIRFDASLAVRTAPENRPKNINLLYCIKHD